MKTGVKLLGFGVVTYLVYMLLNKKDTAEKKDAVLAATPQNSQPEVFYTQLPVQDPFYNAHPSIEPVSPKTEPVASNQVESFKIAPNEAKCVTVEFSANQGAGGYVTWQDCDLFPRKQYVVAGQKLKVCAMNGTAKGLPYTVIGEC